MRTKRTERYIPNGYVLLKETALLTVYWNKNPDRPTAISYIRKALKPNWHFRFESMESMERKIENLLSNLTSNEEYKTKRRLERKQEILDIKIGDLFYTSWGYDQTNVDFFQVVEKKGMTFTVRKIAAEGLNYQSHGMACDLKPVPNKFIGEPIKRRSTGGKSSSEYLYKTTADKKHYSSWYA